MSLSNEQIIDAIASKSLVEVMELVKALEEEVWCFRRCPGGRRCWSGRCRPGCCR